MSVPQFGERVEGREHPDRPAAFAVLEQAGRIALVRVESRRRGLVFDLPGGGVEAGETHAEAAVRECAEEAGLRVVVASEPFMRADHYFINDQGHAHNTRGQFFTGRVLAEAPELKVEDDHTLVWTEPYEALRRLDRDAHAWGVAVWLRQRAG